jgi:hypothetical protein
MKMTWKDIRVVGILFVFFFLSSCSNQQDVLKMKKTSKIIKEEYHIPQEDETLYVLHKSVPTQKAIYIR